VIKVFPYAETTVIFL